MQSSGIKILFDERVQSADKKDVKEIPSGIVWKDRFIFPVLSFHMKKDWLIELQALG